MLAARLAFVAMLLAVSLALLAIMLVQTFLEDPPYVKAARAGSWERAQLYQVLPPLPCTTPETVTQGVPPQTGSTMAM